MELKSRRFFPAALAALDSGTPVLGTVPTPKYGRQLAEVEQVERRADVEVVKVTKDNRDGLVGQLARQLAQQLGYPPS